MIQWFAWYEQIDWTTFVSRLCVGVFLNTVQNCRYLAHQLLLSSADYVCCGVFGQPRPDYVKKMDGSCGTVLEMMKDAAISVEHVLLDKWEPACYFMNWLRLYVKLWGGCWDCWHSIWSDARCCSISATCFCRTDYGNDESIIWNLVCESRRYLVVILVRARWFIVWHIV